MVTEKTLNNINETLDSIIKSGLSINTYFKTIKATSACNFYTKLKSIRNEYREVSAMGESPKVALMREILSKYDKIRYNRNPKTITVVDNISTKVENVATAEEVLDTDDKVESSILRNEEGTVVGYKFKVYRRDKTPIEGTLTRDEMNLIYRLYSYYGASITQREVSRYFVDYSLQDFKRILRAFNITKASGPYAPHMYEEYDEEELKERHLREKENDFLKRIEKDELKDIQSTAVKLAQENNALKQQLEALDTFEYNIPNLSEITVPKINHEYSEKSIVLFLSDMHIGSKCNSYTLYPNEWNREELRRRLDETINKLAKIGRFDEIVLNLMGDNLDGMDNQTARRDHTMPQNMDNMEQVETFMSEMVVFVAKLRELANKVSIYSVKCGNHDGTFGYVATLALQQALYHVYPDIPFTLFKDFIGMYEFKGHTYLICHGKDEAFMKKGLPLNINERTQVFIYEWMQSNGVTGDNVHFVKGDLHSNALNSCRAFDYRNVLSLYGASDYSNFNFSRNSYGVSYDLFIDNIRTLGTFENL